MESPAYQDQNWLLGCLAATLGTAHDTRAFAEESLRQAALQPGFGTALTMVTVNKENPVGLRQLAAVLLKQFIKQHWQEDEKNFVPPVVSASEKGVVRQVLLQSLDDSYRMIRTAVSMAIASIAQYDWPENWPELLPFLLKLINDLSNVDGVRGALRCLALLSDDLDDTSVPKLIPDLFPALYTIISSSHLYEKSLCAKALSIVHSCISILCSMSGVYKQDVRNMMAAMLSPLMEQFSKILQLPADAYDPYDWDMKMQVLKCLLQLVVNFPRLPEAQFLVILAPLWQAFVSSVEVYNVLSVQGRGDDQSDKYDSGGGEKSVESFVIQFFELWTTILGNSRLRKTIAAKSKELVYYTIAFQQITEEQVQTWSADVNQFVADEEDVTYSCRVSGSLMLEEFVNSHGEEGMCSFLEASQVRFQESCESKLAGSVNWWKLQEATLFAVASVSEQLCEIEGSSLAIQNVRDITGRMVSESAGTGVHEYPFLHARIFSTVAKFTTVLRKEICQQFLNSASHAIALDIPLPVKVGACRALGQLLPECDRQIVQPHVMQILSSLIDLLRQASDSTLHLVLDTLQAAIKSGHEDLTSVEPHISPIILDVWAHHISDPFISIDAVEVLEAIKNAPGCLQPLISRVLPTIASILEKARVQQDGLVAGSLDLLTMILKNAPVDVVKAIFDTCFLSIIQIILESDDHGEMQNATECLAALVSGGRQHLLVWGGDQGLTMKRLLDAASRLLDPGLEGSVSLFVGSYILQLILHLPSQMSLHIRELVAAIVKRMQSCEITGLRSSLIVTVARLVHFSAPNIDQFIQLLLSIPADGFESSFAYVMSEWTLLQGEIQGAYQIKVTTTALALLLSSGHPELGKVEVRGHLVKSNSGITTRSKAKSAPEQWTTIFLPEKVFLLLADTIAEIQEQANSGADDDDEDSEWEEDAEYAEESLQDTMYASSVPSNANPSVAHLNAIAETFGEDDDGNYSDELAKADPINQINLAEFLTNVVVNLSDRNPTLFNHLCQNLTGTQMEAVKLVLRK